MDFIFLGYESLGQKNSELYQINELFSQTYQYGIKHTHSTLLDHIRRLENEIADMKKCQICWMPFNDTNRAPAKGKCSHAIYCMECLVKVAKTNGSCPTCREKLDINDIVKLTLNYS